VSIRGRQLPDLNESRQPHYPRSRTEWIIVLRILIADDHQILRLGARIVLEQQPGWHVREASNGREAVKLALKMLPHVILLDLFMPEMNGLETTRVIKKELPHTEVLIFTFSTLEELMREVLIAGARGYLLKTDFTRNIVAAVETVAKHEPFFSWEVSKMLLDTYVKQATSVPSVSGLTLREREMVQLLAEGCGDRSVARLLEISTKTARRDRKSILRKIGATSVTELVRYAVRNKMIEP
jgi:DNA-binding NarL/FixJ family response regulator